MEWMKQIKRLKNTPDYLLLAYKKYGPNKNDVLTPIQYNDQLNIHMTIKNIVRTLHGDLWTEDKTFNETESRAQTLTRYLVVSRLALYFMSDAETTHKFKLEFNELTEDLKSRVIENYNKYLKAGQWITGQFIRNNPGLYKEWTKLDEFIYRWENIIIAKKALREGQKITWMTLNPGRPKTNIHYADIDESDEEDEIQEYFKTVMERITPPISPKNEKEENKTETPEHLKRSNNPAVMFENTYPRDSKQRAEQDEERARLFKEQAKDFSEEEALIKTAKHAKARTVKAKYLKRLAKTKQETQNEEIKEVVNKLIDVETSLFITMDDMDLRKKAQVLRAQLAKIRKNEYLNSIKLTDKSNDPLTEVIEQREKEICDDLKETVISDNLKETKLLNELLNLNENDETKNNEAKNDNEIPNNETKNDNNEVKNDNNEVKNDNNNEEKNEAKKRRRRKLGDKILCECKGFYTQNRSRHLKTKLHMDYIKNNDLMDVKQRTKAIDAILCPCNGSYAPESEKRHLKSKKHTEYIKNTL